MNNSKPMLLSLSLAGAIGFYLYNKLIQTGHVATLSPTQETCEEKTRRELAARPVIEQPQPVFEDVVETVEPVIEPAVEQDEFDMLLNDAAIEPVVEEAPVEEVAEEVPVVADGDNDAMSFEDLMNMANEEPANLFEDEPVEEPVAEPVVEEPVIETPVLEDVPTLSFVNLAKPVEEPVEAFAPVVAPIANDEVVDLLADIDEPVAIEQPAEPEYKDKGFKSLEDMPIQDLLEKDKQALMENSESLHNVDAKDPAAKREFDSIMDFFNEI